MSQDYSNGYNLNNLANILNFKGKIKKDNLDANTIKIFEFFDINKNGEIDRSELNEILGQVTSYGASNDKSIFDKNEAIRFISSYKNKSNQTLKQLGIKQEDLYKFLDRVKNITANRNTNLKIKQNLQNIGIGSTYREIALWLCRQEQKNPPEAVVREKEKELKELNKNANPPLVDGELNGKYVKISVKQSGIKNVSNYIANTMSKAIKGFNWNASGIKKIQEKFTKGEINRYNIVEVLEGFNYTKDQSGNIVKKTQLGDKSIIDAIISETELGDNSNKIRLMNSIIDTLAQAASDNGVSGAEIKKYTTDFKTEMNRQMKFFEGTGIAPADSQKMDNIIESFIAIIKNPIKDVKPNYEQVEKFAQENKTTVLGDVKDSAYETANEFYNIIDENSGKDSMAELLQLVNNSEKFNAKTIVDIITAYNESGIRHKDPDIVYSILDESHDDAEPIVDHENRTYIAKGEAYLIIDKMINLLKQAAREKGVLERFIKEAQTEWMREMYELKVEGSERLEEHEIHTRYMNKLIGLIGGKTTGARGAYDDARAQDSVVGIGADYAFGIFGCKTMSDMEKKLGSHAKDAKYLVALADKIKEAQTDADKNKFMALFNAKYKAIFGVDFNPTLMEKRGELQERVAKVQIYDSLEGTFNEVLRQSDSENIKSVINNCKTVMGVTEDGQNIYLSEVVDEQVGLLLLGLTYSEQTSVKVGDKTYEINTEADAYKFVISQMKGAYKTEAEKAQEGTTFKQMQIDLEQMNQAVYGNENIGKEVANFNQNQALVQQYTELGLDIGITIGTCWIPGLGEAAGLKMLNTFGNLAAKGGKLQKLYKGLELAGKGLYNTSKGAKALQQGQAVGKIVQVGDKSVRVIRVGNKTIQLGKVANLALETTISGAYNAVNSGVTVTGLHLLEGHSFDESYEAGKGMAIFGMVSAAGSFAGKLAAGIAGKMGCSLQTAQKAIAFVIEQGANFGFANYETVSAYIKAKQKTDPNFDFSKMSMEELWDVLVSDENLINNLIMVTMTVITHTTQNMKEKAEQTNTDKLANISIKPDDVVPVNPNANITSYKYKNSLPAKDFTPLLNDKIRESGISTKNQRGCFIKGTPDTPLGTSGVGNCAVICLYNSKTNTSALYHAVPIKRNAVSHMQADINIIMPEGFDKVFIVPGRDPETAKTATNLLNAAKGINKNAQVELRHTTTGDNTQIIFFNGDIYELPLENNQPSFKVCENPENYYIGMNKRKR